VSGQLHIVGQQTDQGDLAALDPSDPNATVVNVPRALPFLRILPALIVVAAALLKMRRTRSALLVLVPYGAILGSLALIGLYMGADGYSAVHPAALAGATGLALVWLLVDWTKGPLDRTLRILGVMIGMGVLVLAVYTGLEAFTQETAVPILLCGIGVVTLAAVLLTASRRPRPRSLRWMLLGLLFRFAVVSLLVTSTVLILTMAVLVARGALPPVTIREFPMVLTAIGAYSLFIGGAGFAVFLPFLVLSLVNPFYRERFAALFPLKEREKKNRRRIFGVPRCML
jgi:hypothetical protein